MKILLIILAIFIPSSMMAKAETSITSEVKNIDLNIKEHQTAVTFLSLSAGEATLIQGPKGETILVNIGGEKTGTELEGLLSLYDVKEISTLILTNDGQEPSFHKISHLITKYNIKEIVTTPALAALLTKNLYQSNFISINVWGEGTKKEILPDMIAEVQYIGKEKNEGLDLMLRFFKHGIFLMTSFSDRSVQSLLKKDLEDVHVFKIPNSLSKVQKSNQLIQTLNPQISILFAAEGDHLDSDLLQELNSIWSEVYFTKKHGTITIKFTESNYEIITIPVKVEE